MGDVTRDELRDLRDDIVGRMTDGFSGVHQRLDTLNGRTSKGEVAIAAADVRMANLEREVFRRHRTGGETVPALTLADLKWYLAVAGGSIGGTYWVLHALGLLK
jgi:hypothetical protein